MAKYKLKIDLGDWKAGHIEDGEDQVFPVFNHYASNRIFYYGLLTNTKVWEKVEERTYSAYKEGLYIVRALDDKWFHLGSSVYVKDYEEEYVFIIEEITLQDNTAILSGGNVAFDITEVEFVSGDNWKGSWRKY
jgi:hypothetical protein